MSKEELFRITSKMEIREEEVRNNIWFLEKTGHSKGLVLIAILNYGYMLGVQAERAKRKAHS